MQHTNKNKAKNKRIALAEPPKPKPLPAKAKGVTRTVDKNIKGLAYETRPVHEPQCKRLPEREGDYLHRTSLKVEPSEREAWAISAYERNLPLDQILIGSGFTVDNLLSCLGIARTGNEKLREWLEECKKNNNNI